MAFGDLYGPPPPFGGGSGERLPSWTPDTIGPPTQQQFIEYVDWLYADGYESARKLKEIADRAFDDSFLGRLAHAKAMDEYEKLIQTLAEMKVITLSDLK
tara:strand:+ start:231 stop:530 length:300 start_codon:yes stop_codon:yes gene_type:complete